MSPITEEQIEKLKKVEGIDGESIVEQKSLDITYITSKETDKKYLFAAEALPPGNVKVDTVTGGELDLRADEYQIVIEEKYVEPLGYTNEEIIGKKIQLVVLDEYTHQEKVFDAKVVGVIAPGVVSMGQSYTNNKLADDIYDEIRRRDEYALSTHRSDRQYGISDQNPRHWRIERQRNDRRQVAGRSPRGLTLRSVVDPTPRRLQNARRFFDRKLSL